MKGQRQNALLTWLLPFRKAINDISHLKTFKELSFLLVSYNKIFIADEEFLNISIAIQEASFFHGSNKWKHAFCIHI